MTVVEAKQRCNQAKQAFLAAPQPPAWASIAPGNTPAGEAYRERERLRNLWIVADADLATSEAEQRSRPAGPETTN